MGMLTLVEPDPSLFDRFLSGSLSGTDARAHPVVERWARARSLGATISAAVPAADLNTVLARRERLSAIFARAQDLFEDAARELERRGCALVLADAEGVILASRGSHVFRDPAIRAGLAEGVRWNESTRGTNAIGTALAECAPVAVLGRAHYEPVAHSLACYGAPILDASGQPIAVLDVTGRVEDADPIYGILVQSLAATFESVLFASSRARPATVDAPFSEIAGDDPAIVRARDTAARFAASRLPIVLFGETGTGKELFARTIHLASGAAGAFVAASCAALTETSLAEKLAAAEGGTLFLDEVAELELSLQASLLRVAGVRLICASTIDLATRVREESFRADLFYRIHGVEIRLPPLRERHDLAGLVQALLKHLSYGSAVPSISEAALGMLKQRAWPGNVRELRSALEYARVIATGAPAIEADHFPQPPLATLPRDHSAGGRHDAEAVALHRALRDSNGNLSQAARILGVARSTLYRMMTKHGAPMA